MTTSDTNNTIIEKPAQGFCSSKGCKRGMIIALVLLSIYFVFDVYNKVTIGLVQYNQQMGYRAGQQDLVAQLFKEMETKKCQKIPVTLQEKTVEIVDVACLSSNDGPAQQNAPQPQGEIPAPQQNNKK